MKASAEQEFVADLRQHSHSWFRTHRIFGDFRTTYVLNGASSLTTAADCLMVIIMIIKIIKRR
jgi:hypothetical protein